MISWWATFPAIADSNLTVYSDRLTEQLIGLESDTAGLAAPAEAAATARKLRVTRTAITAGMLAPFLRVGEAELAQIRSGERSWEDPIGGLARVAAATETTSRLTLHELRRGTPILFTYLEGTDTIGHLFGSFRSPAQPGVSRADAERLGGVIDRYYAHVDAWLGEIVEQTVAADTIVIVSDHGFTWGSDRPPVAPGARTATAEWWHRPEGVFIAAGPSIQRTIARRGMHALDFAPAVLAIAGVSSDAGFPGQVPTWLLRGSDLRNRASVNYAALLPRKPVPATGPPDAGEQEQLAKLRALGYLGGGDGGVGGGTKAPGDRAEARQLNNLGSSQLAAGDGEAAEQSFRRAIAADASYAAPHYNLALLYRGRGLIDDADREFWKAVDYGIADREMAIVRLALDYRQRGDAARALAVFREGRKRFPGSESIWLNSGVFLGEQRDYEGARACLERAVAINPRNPAAYRNLGAALAALGRREAARRALTTASRLDPSNAAIRRELSQLGGPQP